MSPDSVVLEMFFVRFPFGDPAVNEKLWEAIDEQQFAPELRAAADAERFPRGPGQRADTRPIAKLHGTERQAGRPAANR